MLRKSLGKFRILRKFGLQWSKVPQAPADPILSIGAAFQADTHPKKVNVCIGAYRDEEGKSWILSSVQAAMKKMNKELNNLEYLGMNGDPEFVEAALKVGYGEDSKFLNDGRVAGTQVLSGCGGINLTFKFIKKFWEGNQVVYISDPSWPIHHSMAHSNGLKTATYPYFHPKTLGLDFEGMLKGIEDAPDRSIILLHPVAHNPTGVDPTLEQWAKIRDMIVKKGHLTFFDCAYQGFASGNLRADAGAMKIWEDNDVPFILTQSFAKSMGLYGTRTGVLSIVGENSAEATKLKSQLGNFGRNAWGTPPLQGSYIAKILLNDPEYYKMWEQDLLLMSGRIREMREALVQKLADVGNRENWDHITDQIGMFAYTGLKQNECEEMIKKYHIYLTMNGRISIAGLNYGNLDYFVNAVDSITKNRRK